MKAAFRNIVLATVVLALAYGCDYNKFGEYEPEIEEPPVKNITISTIRQNLYLSKKPLIIDKELTVRVTVTANDYSGNLYHSFYVEDGTDAMEIRGGLYYLYNYYPVGAELGIELKGLSVGLYGGTIQLGIPSTEPGARPVDPFGHKPLLDKYVTHSGAKNNPQPKEVSVDGFSKELAGHLIRVPAITLCEGESKTWGEVQADGELGNAERQFEDSSGAVFGVYTSGYATFAEEVIPDGLVEIVGILTMRELSNGGEYYTLKMRDSSDCKKL